MKHCYTKIILLIFCSVVFSYTNIKSQSGNAQSLELGNEWIYFHDGGPSGTYFTHKEVVADTTLNNSNYAVVKSNEFYSYQRADSNIVYYFNTQDSTEYISLNYNWNIGDTVNPDPQNFSRVIDKSTISIWGKILRTICIHSTYLYFSNSTNWYTEWIGLTSGEGHIPGTYYTVTLLAANIENNIYGDTTLLVIDYNENEILSDFIVYQNYPNPFNPNTTIVIEIPTSGEIKFSVYNLLGQKLESNNYYFSNKGRYKINFDAKNYSSGIYIYTLEFKNRIKSKTMLFLK